MAPIRLGLIGLSQSAITSWAANGHIPYLLSPLGRQHYQIVALLNSSEAAARKSIAHYELGADVRAYGSPRDLAADPAVDMVVVATRVDVHYDTVLPSLEALKMAFVEWPLAENAVRAAELAKTAKGRTMVGLQGRVSPSIKRLKALLDSGVVGEVLSSHARIFTPGSDRDGISDGMGYFLDRKIGGNLATIAFGHTIDFIHHTLGEFTTAHWHAQIQRPDQVLRHASGSTTAVTTDVPDLISVHGTLISGATLLVDFQRGKPFPGTSPFTWTMEGSKGEIRLSCSQGSFLGSIAHASPVLIEVCDHETEEVTRFEWEWEEWQKELNPVLGRSVAMLYELFAAGKGKEAGIVDFNEAVERHKELDGFLYGQ